VQASLVPFRYGVMACCLDLVTRRATGVAPRRMFLRPAIRAAAHAPADAVLWARVSPCCHQIFGHEPEPDSSQGSRHTESLLLRD
jgi:hypothetical protein